jgi:hypothetical protein
MERESFEDAATAALLNDHFVSIKVDREERPDVDKVYMTFVQATTGGGAGPGRCGPGCVVTCACHWSYSCSASTALVPALQHLTPMAPVAPVAPVAPSQHSCPSSLPPQAAAAGPCQCS